jgi:hypothetical protein
MTADESVSTTTPTVTERSGLPIVLLRCLLLPIIWIVAQSSAIETKGAWTFVVQVPFACPSA